MKRKLIIAMAISLIAYPYLLTRSSAATSRGLAGSSQTTNLYSADELDNLLAPIALYPDPLLAQMLPASTFVDQITQAAQWLKANNNPAQIDNQPWDVSVKAMAHYPQVLYKMGDQLDWTTALGQAYVGQSTDVAASIQRLRTQARNAGTLVSTPQQTVAVNNGYVAIEPAQPTVIYVPQYNPDVVYAYPSTGAIVASSLISFGTGLAMGAWLNRGWNWGGGGIYYHGWRGGGWIGASRPYVNHRSAAYVGNNFNNINVNRNVINRNVNAANLNRFNSVHRNTNWGNVDRANMGRHARPGTGSPGRPGAGTLPARPGTPGGRPGTPGARPGTLPSTSGARPGASRPGTPGARPGTLPSSSGARSGTSRPAPVNTARGGRANSSMGGGGRHPGHSSMGGGGRSHASHGGMGGGGRSHAGHGGGGRSRGGGGGRRR